MTTLITKQEAAGDLNPGSRGRLDYIDALRGVACLFVLIFHNFGGVASPAILHRPIGLAPKIFLMSTGIGWIGVPLFLVLSGFCLFYPVVTKMPVDQVTVDPRKFYGRRVRRILPPYYAALFLFVLMEHGYKHISGYSILLHMLMLQNLDPHVVATINNAMWTLALECQLYVLFPLFLCCIRKFGIFGFVRIALAISIIWRLALSLYLPDTIGWEVTVQYYEAVPGYAVIFVVGMAAAAMIARPDPDINRRVRIFVWTALPIAVAIALIGGYAYHFAGVLWGCVFAGVVALTAGTSNARLHTHPVLVALSKIGVFSYSIYLIHDPLMRLFTPELWNLSSTLSVDSFLLLRLIVLIGIAFLFFRIFERPFLSHRVDAPSTAAG